MADTRIVAPVERGQTKPYVWRLIEREIATAKDGELVIRIGPKPNKRSVDQLRYWFGVPIAMLIEKTGYTKMQQHYICMALCFGVLIDEKTGLSVPVVPASRHLTAKQFSEAIEWVGPWAFEQFEIEIPLPEQVDFSSLPGVEEAA